MWRPQQKASVAVMMALTFSAARLRGADSASAAGEFTATAAITTSQGSRSMPIGIVVTNPLTPSQALPLKKVLEDGGQQALLNAIRGGGRGTLQLGGLAYPLDLVVAQPTDDGFRYVVVTTRPIKYDETIDSSPSLDFPFGILVFDSASFGTTTGVLYTRGALSISDEGRVQASQYGGEPGTLNDVKQVNKNP